MAQKICPRCGKPNPPDARFCQYCGYPLQGSAEGTAVAVNNPAPVAAQQPAQTLRLDEEQQAGAPSGTQVFGLSVQQPRQPAPAAAPQQPQIVHIGEPPGCSGSPLPAPYYLVFPDGRILVRYYQMCVYGREDFEAFIPREYARFITRRSKGGQFTIYCEIKDVNTIVCYIRDDFSTNPTLVNGVPIKGKGAVRLNDGDIISPAGIVNLRFNYASPPRG